MKNISPFVRNLLILAVIAAAVNPAGEFDVAIDVVRAERSAGYAREFRMGHVMPP